MKSNLAKTIVKSSDNPNIFYLCSVSEKSLMKWDFREMQKPVQTLKCDLNIIRQLQVYGDYAIVGGKGGQSAKYKGIQVLDFRKESIIESYEKSQDIMSMVINQDTIYMGLRSHSIRQSALTTYLQDDGLPTLRLGTMNTFDPPHYDQ